MKKVKRMVKNNKKQYIHLSVLIIICVIMFINLLISVYINTRAPLFISPIEEDTITIEWKSEEEGNINLYKNDLELYFTLNETTSEESSYLTLDIWRLQYNEKVKDETLHFKDLDKDKMTKYIIGVLKEKEDTAISHSMKVRYGRDD